MISYFHKSESPIFSILICSLHKREEFLKRLLNILRPQLTDQINVIMNIDSGEISIGAKRNQLVDESLKDTSKYISFIDDDDRVSDDYCSRIITAIGIKDGAEEVDCIGLEGIITFDGANPKKFIHSLKYTEWFEKDSIFYRNPNHLNPIKKEIACQARFPEINHGEDKDFSVKVLPFLKKENHLEGEPIYFYEYISNKPKKTTHRERMRNRILARTNRPRPR